MIPEFDVEIARISYEQRARWVSVGAPCVYFIRAGEFVKIGKCSGHPSTRMAQLQTGCPFPMWLAVFVRGDVATEHELHDRFSRYRVQLGNEWFHYEGELKVFVEELVVNFAIGEVLS